MDGEIRQIPPGPLRVWRTLPLRRTGRERDLPERLQEPRHPMIGQRQRRTLGPFQSCNLIVKLIRGFRLSGGRYNKKAALGIATRSTVTLGNDPGVLPGARLGPDRFASQTPRFASSDDRPLHHDRTQAHVHTNGTNA